MIKTYHIASKYIRSYSYNKEIRMSLLGQRRTSMSIYLVRHGETDWNACQKMQGKRDIELNII